MPAALAVTPTSVAPVVAPVAAGVVAATTASATASTATASTAPVVISDAGNSILYDAEPALRLALGTAPFRNHTIGGFGVSVLPEVWQGVFGRDVPADHPAVVVVMMGNRDFPVALAQPDVYRSELDQAVRLVTSGGTRVLWLGLPPLPPNVLDERGREAVNALFAELPTRFPGLVHYVATDAVLGAPDGTFARSLPGADGRVVPVRKENPDGTPNEHLCPEGAVRLTTLIREQLASLVALPAAPSAWQAAAWRTDPRFDDPVDGCRS